ncbi:MAG: DUF11 domain-containing protein [Planctomycetales bacterium]|nr:DUF11 domain-containing protein [Planctomycetales bacterium]
MKYGFRYQFSRLFGCTVVMASVCGGCQSFAPPATKFILETVTEAAAPSLNSANGLTAAPIPVRQDAKIQPIAVTHRVTDQVNPPEIGTGSAGSAVTVHVDSQQLEAEQRRQWQSVRDEPAPLVHAKPQTELAPVTTSTGQHLDLPFAGAAESTELAPVVMQPKPAVTTETTTDFQIEDADAGQELAEILSGTNDMDPEDSHQPGQKSRDRDCVAADYIDVSCLEDEFAPLYKPFSVDTTPLPMIHVAAADHLLRNDSAVRPASIEPPLVLPCPADEACATQFAACPPLSKPGPGPRDEYLCDGGDANGKVIVRSDRTLRNLDLEDTVGHFDTADGRTVVTPSNSVCIYSPRFAAIRHVSGAREDDLIVGHQAQIQLAAASADLQQENSLDVFQPVATQRDVALLSLDSLRDRNLGVEDAGVQHIHLLRSGFAYHEDIQVIRFGIYKGSEKAVLAERMEAAEVWTEQQSAQVLIDSLEAIVEKSFHNPGLLYHVKPGEPKLRVIKVASTGAAAPGEEVAFTLRFDNVGDQPIDQVTVIDNLTTRLEYVKDSAECDLDAEFKTDENNGDSLTVSWTIKEPIKPGEGGIIRFRCRVR